MEIEKAIDKALDEMPKDFEIRPYLQANRVWVKKMLLTEYNEAETMEMFKEEGREEQAEEDAKLFSDAFGIPIEQVRAVLKERSEKYADAGKV